MSRFIIEPLGKLLFDISQPITSFNIARYKRSNPNASDIELDNLPLSHVGNIGTNPEELNLWNKFSAMIDYTYPITKLQKTAADDKLWKELKYCMTFAAYSYFMPILGKPDPQKVFQEETDFVIIEQDISLIGHKTKHIAEPGYFIGIDKTNKRILLCIRGTMSRGDSITDLHAIPDRLSFGINRDENGPFYDCHPGMFNAANYLHKTKNVTGKIQQYLKELPEEERKDYKVFVTGHSLGAGVCSLLGLLWKSQNVFPDDKFKCFSFASPLVIGKEGANKSISTMDDSQINMISVAVESDLVTRLSVKGLIELSARIDKIRQNSKAYQTLYDRIEASRTMTGKITRAELDSLAKLTNIMDDMKTETKELADLYPAGRVLWWVPDCVVDPDFGYNEYQQLLNLVELQASPFSSIRILQLIYGMMRSFYGGDSNEKLCEFKQVKDRFEFTQMVIHGDESFHAHFPGRYLIGLGVDMMDIFRMSRNYQRLHQRLKIPQWIMDIILFIIFVIVFFVLRIIGFIGDVIDFIF